MLIFSLTQGIISKMVFKIFNWRDSYHSKKDWKNYAKKAGLA